MYNSYCKNCNNIIGKWYNIHNCYKSLIYCNFTNSKNIPIFFLNCINCKKFVGILCDNVCKNCFGKDLIFEEKNLFNFFLKYKKITDFDDNCKKCNMDEFRTQPWFFKELTFENKKRKKFNILKKVLFKYFL